MACFAERKREEELCLAVDVQSRVVLLTGANVLPFMNFSIIRSTSGEYLYWNGAFCKVFA